MIGRASAPASSANLGPGFDVLALALDLRCEVTVDSSAEWAIVTGGVPADEEAAALIRAAAGAAGADGPLAVEVSSEIPVARGLGSSAAVIVATAAAVQAARGEAVDPWTLAGSAAAVEGHADNVAAACLGGLTMVGVDGRPRSLPLHRDLRPVVAVPAETLSTRRAREALAADMPRAAAARSLARLAALVDGLRTGEAMTLAAAAGDEMHEGPRRELSPLTGELVEAARGAGALHAAWSGAGPSVLALTREPEAVTSAFESVLAGRGTVLQPAVAPSGVVVG